MHKDIQPTLSCLRVRHVVWPHVMQVFENWNAQLTWLDGRQQPLPGMCVDLSCAGWGVLDWLESIHDEIIIRTSHVADARPVWDVRQAANEVSVLGELEYLMSFTIGNKNVIVVSEHAVCCVELAWTVTLTAPRDGPPFPFTSLVTGGQHKITGAIPGDHIQPAVEESHVGARELRCCWCAPWNLLGLSVRIVVIGSITLEFATLWHIQLLPHSTIQADYKYSLVVILRHRDHCLVLVLEHHYPMDVALEPLIVSKQLPGLQVWTDSAESVPWYAGVDDASGGILIEPSVHVLLKGLGIPRERSSQLTVPSKYSLALASGLRDPAQILQLLSQLSKLRLEPCYPVVI